jgi:hypothetical protein
VEASEQQCFATIEILFVDRPLWTQGQESQQLGGSGGPGGGRVPARATVVTRVG